MRSPVTPSPAVAESGADEPGAGANAAKAVTLADGRVRREGSRADRAGGVGRGLSRPLAGG
jgi:hypothetical protein